MIHKTTALSLLRVIHAPAEREEFSASNVLREFIADHGIGAISRNKAIFGATHKERIRALLKAMNIDPNSPPDAWGGRSRAEALALGPDEKWTDRKVRGCRIAIKALPGQALVIDGNPLPLPVGANLEWSVADALRRLAHDAVVVVENWECFEVIERLQIDFSPAGATPLILWRGGVPTATTGAAYEFLRGYRRPVWSRRPPGIE